MYLGPLRFYLHASIYDDINYRDIYRIGVFEYFQIKIKNIMYFPNLVCRIICTWITAQEFSGIIAFMFLIFLTIIRMLATYEFSVKVFIATFLLLLLMNIGLLA